MNARAKHETWRDLLPANMPSPSVIGRRALLAECARLGAVLDERQLRHFEAQGMLPRPVRQYHEGSIQAVYPPWMPVVVAHIWQQRKAGRPVTTLVEEMPDFFRLRALEYVFVLTNTILLDQLRLPFAEDLRRIFGEMVRYFANGDQHRVRRIAVALFEEGNDNPFTAIVWNPPSEVLSATPISNLPNDINLSVTPLNS